MWVCARRRPCQAGPPTPHRALCDPMLTYTLPNSSLTPPVAVAAAAAITTLLLLPPPALHGISPEEVHARLAHFLKFQLSVALVLDTSLGQALALSESAAEFVNRCVVACVWGGGWRWGGAGGRLGGGWGGGAGAS